MVWICSKGVCFAASPLVVRPMLPRNRYTSICLLSYMGQPLQDDVNFAASPLAVRPMLPRNRYTSICLLGHMGQPLKTTNLDHRCNIILRCQRWMYKRLRTWPILVENFAFFPASRFLFHRCIWRPLRICQSILEGLAHPRVDYLY